jgi:hypothetical protein
MSFIEADDARRAVGLVKTLMSAEASSFDLLHLNLVAPSSSEGVLPESRA